MQEPCSAFWEGEGILVWLWMVMYFSRKAHTKENHSGIARIAVLHISAKQYVGLWMEILLNGLPVTVMDLYQIFLTPKKIQKFLLNNCNKCWYKVLRFSAYKTRVYFFSIRFWIQNYSDLQCRWLQLNPYCK